MGNDWPIYALEILLVVTWMAVLYIAGSRNIRAIRAKTRAARASLEVPPRVIVFGEASALTEVREPLSVAIHSCLVEFFGKADDETYRPYQRYVPLPAENIEVPRSNGYLMIDVEVCEGLIAPSRHLLLMTLHERLNLPDADIRLLEIPGPNWMVNGRITTD
ncbi:hypothetical protein NE236_18295 [Actinoallomurus purpureus]|uniref:hypothetical protein n=1 Tax=Actinoallomurus purpureus TaxID=478114 RepID=UPI002093BD3B|nr:hypothetical protein [Actinoallomurus purpureus]MCO6006941.1 hypothetical protein [Actinoallomurus purpureus]